MKSFTTTLIGAATIATAVTGIELTIQAEAENQATEIAALAQVEGCGDSNIGTPVLYLGPDKKKPNGYTYANNAPGMNLLA